MKVIFNKTKLTKSDVEKFTSNLNHIASVADHNRKHDRSENQSFKDKNSTFYTLGRWINKNTSTPVTFKKQAVDRPAIDLTNCDLMANRTFKSDYEGEMIYDSTVDLVAMLLIDTGKVDVVKQDGKKYLAIEKGLNLPDELAKFSKFISITL